MREQRIESDGCVLFAVDEGRGVPIVFFHGGLGDHRGARWRVGALAASHRLITPDLRGSGRSHFHGRLSWDVLARDAIAWLHDLAIDRAVIGGISFDTGVATRVALAHPDRVGALAIVSPAFGDAPNEAQRAAMIRMSEFGERTEKEGIAALLPIYDALPAPIREVAVRMARDFDPKSVAATTRFLATNEPPFTSLAALTSIEVPVLLVRGADPTHPPELADAYAAHLRDARVLASDVDLAAAIATLAW